MRTTNKHPQWHNQPLRLNTREREKPLEVFQEFFDSYHLEEVRQILWDWMVEMVTNQRSISSNPRDRKNNIYFYERIEALVEAAFVIQMKRIRTAKKKAIKEDSKKTKTA